MKKYKITDDYIIHKGYKLFRIEALKNFNDVKIGDIGGYIASEENLEQHGKGWVYDEAKVYENAVVLDNAVVRGNAEVYGNATILDASHILGNSKIYGHAKIYPGVWINGEAEILGNVKVATGADINRNAYISKQEHVYVCKGKYGELTFFRTKDKRVGLNVDLFSYSGYVEDFYKYLKSKSLKHGRIMDYHTTLTYGKSHIKMD